MLASWLLTIGLPRRRTEADVSPLMMAEDELPRSWSTFWRRWLAA